MNYTNSSMGSVSGSRAARRPFEFGRTYVVRPHQATIVWLHGLGDNGSSWSQLLENLHLPNIKWICPTAPTRPVALLGGFPCTAWFDVGEISEDGPDDIEGLDASVAHIANLLSTEPADIKLGIGGFSMDAATALYSATCFAQGKYGNGDPYPINLRAIVGLSGWLPGSSEADEIYKICSVIGSPTEIEWVEGLDLASAINYQFPQLAAVPLSVLIPSASKAAISLITSLCSWDPCKRPTALEALQHPFFQSCYYVPPSLRSKPAVVRTPPFAGTRGSLEQKCVRRYSGTLPNSRPPGILSSVNVHSSLNAGVQLKLDMSNQDAIKYDKTLKNTAWKQPPRYRPPARDNPTTTYTGKAFGVSDAAEKLANMKICSGKQPTRQLMPPPMKAGGWNGQSDHFFGRSQEIQHGRAYTRKVAG